MNKNTITKMTISLTEEHMKTLKDLSEKEHRSYSKQIVHMMDFYLEHKNKRKTLNF